MKEIVGRLPTIPEYYEAYIDSKVNLTYEPKQCCPFHKEDTPSFSYSAEKGKWRCFGSCKCGGDVIALHQKNYKLRSREEAERSLSVLYKVPLIKKRPMTQKEIIASISFDRIREEQLYQKALILANTPDRWLQLDYFMSKTPVELINLEDLIEEWS